MKEKSELGKGIILEPRQKYPAKPNPRKKYGVIVIGAGMAGYSAAMYCGRLGISVLCIGEIPGGTIALTGDVENYPGFISVNGSRLAGLLEGHARDYPSDFLTDIAESVSFDRAKKEFRVISDGKAFHSKAIIFAAGARVRKLGIPGEEEFLGKGVSYCALCDLTQAKGKVAAVAGGGDSAAKEAIILSEYARKVYIICRENALRAEFANRKKIEALVKKGKVELISENEAVRLEGKNHLEKIVLKKPYKGTAGLSAAWLFIYVGREPNSGIVKHLGVKINRKKEIIVDKNGKTNLAGFFAAGDVTDNSPKQAITAAADGVKAAYSAYNYLIRENGVQFGKRRGFWNPAGRNREVPYN
ncbi:MAG: NAD(P)/FAD-dependent oxidoreductase [Candidatus Aenigmatarchaeota archaeon]